ncbi:MAG: argininosuccinate lyase [Proteobacteria bacterium]|nr:argininosuccinate lyase [Pseudomonadota bacterium]
MKKPWSGRFSKKTNKLVESFTESISFDKRLYEDDIEGSIAHVTMLKKQKILTEKEANLIIKGLGEIKSEIEKGEFEFKEEFEDIHMAIEARLKEKIGDIAGKLHTARSRNDQVALDIRLYVKRKVIEIYNLLESLQKVFIEKAEKYKDCISPAYTHLQRAQPVFLGHYLLAFVEMWERDKSRLIDCYKRMDYSPLGSCALAGTTFPLDREFVAKKLGFSGVTTNSMDAVSDRDFAIELLSILSIIMMHLSRLSEDMILWNTYEFSFVILPDDFCTGSSIMPQKKNPDVLELVRGKTGRVYGSLIALLTIMKGLPLTYNRDMQEDKEQIFNGIDTVIKSLEILVPIFERTEFNVKKLMDESKKGFILATEIADYLAKKGVPFRTAHEITGKIVAYCEKNNKDLYDLSLGEFKRFYPEFDRDILDAISIEKAVGAKNVVGGTGKKSIQNQIKMWKKRLKLE